MLSIKSLGKSFFSLCVCVWGGVVAILTFYLDFSSYLNTYWIGNRWITTKTHIPFSDEQVLWSLSRTWSHFWSKWRIPGIYGEWRRQPCTQVCVYGWSRKIRWEGQALWRKSYFVVWFEKICCGNDFGLAWVYFCHCHRGSSPDPFLILFIVYVFFSSG